MSFPFQRNSVTDRNMQECYGSFWLQFGLKTGLNRNRRKLE